MKNKPADILYGGLDPERIKSAKPQFHPEHLEMFREFVLERYAIHVRKDILKQPAPWTDNPILREFKFTNVRREHDRTTKHLLALLNENKDDSYNNKLMNIILYRLYNKMETSDLIGWVDWGSYDNDRIRENLKKAPAGFVYFTDAFMTSGMKRCILSQYPEEEFKYVNIPRVLNREKFNLVKGIKEAKTPSDVIETLKSINGIGSFLAYQMFVDFTYLEEFPWSENEFTVCGPGCMDGLSELFSEKDGLSYEELLFWLRDNCPFTPEELNALMIDVPEDERYMNVMSLENCMCELSKYIRAKEGTGRPRNKYKGGF